MFAPRYFPTEAFAPRYFPNIGEDAGAVAEDLPFLSEAYQYDTAGATGSITGGTVQLSEAIYDSAGATGAIADGTVQLSEAIYDSAGATGAIADGTAQPSETIYD